MGACMSTEEHSSVKVIFWQHAVWNLTPRALQVQVYDATTAKLELDPPVNLLPPCCVMLASESRGLLVLQLQQTLDGWQALHSPGVRLVHLPSSPRNTRSGPRGSGLQHGSCVAIRDGAKQLLQLYPSECRGPTPPLAGVVFDEQGHVAVTRAVQTSSGFLQFSQHAGGHQAEAEAVAVVQQQPAASSKLANGLESSGGSGSAAYLGWMAQLKRNSSGLFNTSSSGTSGSLFKAPRSTTSTSSSTTTAAAVALAAMVAAAAAAVMQTSVAVY